MGMKLRMTVIARLLELLFRCKFICFVFCFAVFETVLLCLPGWSAVVQSQLTATSTSQVVGTTGVHHHTWLIFVFLVEMGFCHDGQVGLKRLASSEPPASASQMLGLQV
uniref:Uncharacterized protein n=1 Tax=Callithrix jacchus TaxID=9483 RepID=A0A8I3WKJ3_CALJA